MNVREATVEWMRARSIRYVFGNPGSTELPFLVGLPESVRYVLALQESVAVAMADGYAQASRTPAFVNLHVAPGLGNAIGMLYTALKNRAPVIVTCGQQDTRHLFHEPLLAGDLVGMARPVVKWAYEVKHAADVPEALEQAYHLAMTPPRGPVFVSIPMDFWDAVGQPPRLRELRPPSAPQGLEVVAEALSRAQKPALVFGAGVGGANALAEAVALAEKTGAAVYHAPLNSRMGFPTKHPLYEGMLLPAVPRLLQALSQHDFVLVVGAPVFLLYPYFPGTLVPPGVRVMLITDDPQEASRAPVEGAFVGDIKRALEELVQRVAPREYRAPSRAAEEARRRSEAARSRAKMGASFVLHTLAQHLPENAIIVDEAISASLCLREYVRLAMSHDYYTAASGGLGWAMPAAIGIQLAQPDRPVVCVVGDGSAMYSVQALWSAREENTPVLFLVLNNHAYNILKSFTKAFYPGCEERVQGLDVPHLDLVQIARGMGIDAERLETPEAIEEAIPRALRTRRPTLLDVVIDPTVPSLL
ncbi:MAG: benzoylformate decarboxylase [Fimbriimonadales bacterium]|nr:benzoylformate decarboxylase [Fimbriimonadales bacterium]MDW8052526.1 benzoylformate decarboxylase [Armatimonadota bacterium]